MFGAFDVVKWYLYRLSIFGFFFFDFCNIFSVCFVEGWVVDVVWKNTSVYKAKEFMFIIFFKKSLHILEDSASSVQVDILNMYLSKISLKHENFTLSLCFPTLLIL